MQKPEKKPTSRPPKDDSVVCAGEFLSLTKAVAAGIQRAAKFWGLEHLGGQALMWARIRISRGQGCECRLLAEAAPWPLGLASESTPTSRTWSACRPLLGMPSAHQSTRHLGHEPAQKSEDGKG